MKLKPVIIILGEPHSIFIEILFKIYKKVFISKIKRPLILIGSKKLLERQMFFFKYKYKINEILIKDIPLVKDNKNINIININLKTKKTFFRDTPNSTQYLTKSFDTALKILKKKIAIGLINGPINKTSFLKKRYEGVTEYLVNLTKSNNYSMIIYNKKLSVSPITTHIPIKKVIKHLNKKTIFKKILLVNEFYFKYFKIKPKIAVLGLNPHCETNDRISEEKTIIAPAIRQLKLKKINIRGPFSSDTFFLKTNYSNFDIVIGMYHDQVLTPIKTLFEFDAINITAGLPFIRISPDHGPNKKMVSKGISNPLSLMKSIKFFEEINDSQA